VKPSVPAHEPAPADTAGAALGFTEHVWLPLAVVRKHVTNPALPQVDFLAHPATDARHCFGRLPLCAAVFATWATQ